MINASVLEQMNFDKLDGLVPAIVVDAANKSVLMQGFMNAEALEATLEEGKVVFYSRTKQRLWMKGESSENYLNVVRIVADCDFDSLLIEANPAGPTCHTGAYSCFHNTLMEVES